MSDVAERTNRPQPIGSDLTPFNGDAFLHAEVARLIAKWRVECVLETGTFRGHTTLAFSLLCERVFAVDIDEQAVERTRTLLDKADVRSAQGIGGSSERAISSLADDLSGMRLLFYLDAHGRDYWPLRDELAAIAAIEGPRPIIVIHDCQVPGRPDLGFDVYKRQPLTFRYVRDCLEAIYDDSFSHRYNIVANGARRGSLFVEPTA